mgnify:FL=1|tara:strand:- start:4230 stop:5210 length:981 start_codon:yes stop_codon:yes gene_type:complete
MFRLSLLCCFFLFFSCTESNTLNNNSSSISELSNLLLVTPNDTVLLKERRNLFINNGDFENALIDQKQLFIIDTTNYVNRFKLAELYFNLYYVNPNYISNSLELISSDDLVYPSILLLRGKLFYILQKYSKSLKNINAYLKSYPFDAEAYFYKGLNYKEIGDVDMAESQFQTAIEQNPNHVSSHEQLAFIYAFKEDTLAKYYFINALNSDSSLLSSWYNLAMYYQNRGNFTNAKKSYFGILRRDSINFDANYNLGYISLVEEKFELAIKYFSTLINLSDTFASVYFSRGLAYKFNNEKFEAQKDFEKTLELNPDFIEAKKELKSFK